MAVHEQRYRLSLGGALGLTIGLLSAGSSCGDPVRDELVKSLGPEKAGVPPGPMHRPNQPCLACHDEEGGEEPLLSVGGTIYQDPISTIPVGDVAVSIFDSMGRSFVATTNCAGNFMVRSSEFAPAYPIWLELDAGKIHRSMDTASFREGSCAACHADPAGGTSAGHVYIIDDPMDPPPPNPCQ